MQDKITITEARENLNHLNLKELQVECERMDINFENLTKEELIEKLIEVGEELNLIEHDLKFQYQMLSRLEQDCKYFLDYGNRNAKHCLYYHDVNEHIKQMEILYNIFPKGLKPKWLTWEQIQEYKRLMNEEE